jgi:colicin import membrane protein
MGSGAGPYNEGLARAVVLAIGLHLMLAVLFWLFSVFEWERPLAAKGLPVMNADLDVSAAEAAAAREALAHEPEPLPPEPAPEPEPEQETPPPQPIPEPVPEQAPVERQVQAQERIPVPDEEEQEEVRRDAISEDTAEREQEEKRRQEQIDLTERERQREAEQRQRLAEQAEAEKRAEREKKLAQIRAERAKLQRQTQLAEQRLRQIADRQAQQASQVAEASGTPPPGNNGVDEGLLQQYIAAIQAAVTSKWTRPENMPSLPCKMRIVQLPGGEVMSVEFDPSCPYDEAGKRSVEAAVRKAQPLPYAGFESVFSRRLIFTFRPD